LSVGDGLPPPSLLQAPTASAAARMSRASNDLKVVSSARG
jgi:hypothetical protein